MVVTAAYSAVVRIALVIESHLDITAHVSAEACGLKLRVFIPRGVSWWLDTDPVVLRGCLPNRPDNSFQSKARSPRVIRHHQIEADEASLASTRAKGGEIAR